MSWGALPGKGEINEWNVHARKMTVTTHVGTCTTDKAHDTHPHTCIHTCTHTPVYPCIHALCICTCTQHPMGCVPNVSKTLTNAIVVHYSRCSPHAHTKKYLYHAHPDSTPFAKCQIYISLIFINMTHVHVYKSEACL